MSAPLPALAGSRVIVWGEPTICRVALCRMPFTTSCSVAGTISRFAGGSTFATAIGIAHLGGTVEFHGPFGADADGIWMLEYARGRGVEVHPIASGTSRSTMIVVDPDGARSMVTDLADAFTRPYADTFEPDRLAGAGLLYVSLSSLIRDPHGSVSRMLQRCAAAIPIGIDLGSASAIESAAELLTSVVPQLRPAVVFANEDEAAALHRVAPGLLDASGCFVEKRGPRPARVTIAGSTIEVPAPAPVVAIDTTGAGDAFAAGFLTAWAAGETDLHRVVTSGHDYAARAVAMHGTVVAD